MSIDELMSKNRPLFDGLSDWLLMEAANTDRAYLREKFTRWAQEVAAAQEATNRVEMEE